MMLHLPMRRRGLGISGLQNKQNNQNTFKKAADNFADEEISQLKEQLKTFHSNLEDFAKKYKKEIKKNPIFRQHFQQMCSKIGVDPLQSNKGFWAEILGVGDFYYELGVQITEVCLSVRQRTGGLLDISVLKSKVEKKRKDEISFEDIRRSISNLKPLGTGYAIIIIGGKEMVQSLPKEMNSDSISILDIFVDGYITKDIVIKKLNWSEERTDLVMNVLIEDGICWIDDTDSGRLLWLPSYFESI